MPTENDLLLQASDSIDSGDDSAAIDTRLRIGSPRRNLLGTTESDAQIAHDVALGLPTANLPGYVDGLTVEPDATDPLAPVKRAQMFTPRIGVNVTSGGHFNAYLRQSFDARVLDGQILWQAIDHEFRPDPTKPDIVPGLSYLRLGKPEKKADGTAGNPETDLATDPLAGQKFNSGIGIFSDGSLNTWAKKEIKFTSDEKIKLISKDLHAEYNGENYTVGYEFKNLDDEKAVKSGAKKASSYTRKIISVDFRRKVGTAWYQQSFKNSWNLAFNSSLKGDVAFSASYGVSIGTKADYSAALSYAFSVSGKAGLSLSYEQEVGKSGSIYKSTAGAYSLQQNNTVKASEQITLQIARVALLQGELAIKAFKVVAAASITAQVGAMAVYNATLIGMARRDMSSDSDEDPLKNALDAGAALYAAASSLCLLTAALGANLAYKQNKLLHVPPPPGVTTISLREFDILLESGLSSISITPNAVRIDAPQITFNGVAHINHNAPVINNNPVPQPPAVNVDVGAIAAVADVAEEVAAEIPEAPPL